MCNTVERVVHKETFLEQTIQIRLAILGKITPASQIVDSLKNYNPK